MWDPVFLIFDLYQVRLILASAASICTFLAFICLLSVFTTFKDCNDKLLDFTFKRILWNQKSFTLMPTSLVSNKTTLPHLHRSSSLLEHFKIHWKCPHKKKSSNLQNDTISELPLDITPTREGSNTLTAKRTQRNASTDHTHLFPPLNTQHTATVSAQSLQKILNQHYPHMTNRSRWCWNCKFDLIQMGY